MTLALYSQSCCKVALCYICTYWYVALPILYSEHWIPFTGVIILLYNSDFDMLLINLTAYKGTVCPKESEHVLHKSKLEKLRWREEVGRKEMGESKGGGREGMQFVVTVILQLNAKKLF